MALASWAASSFRMPGVVSGSGASSMVSATKGSPVFTEKSTSGETVETRSAAVVAGGKIAIEV
jgi:hypothetical protein